MKRTWVSYLFWILLAEGVGGLSGWLTCEGIALYNANAVKPFLTPPAIVFPIVWGILFALMGFGAARVWNSEASVVRTRAMEIFLLQLGVNFFWSIVFFNMQAYGLAFLWILVLWALIFWMIQLFRQVDPLAARLQIPYLLWVSFAAYLNFATWMLNR